MSSVGALARWWACPVLIGLLGMVLQLFTDPGYWVWLLALGFIIGYCDPWNAKGERR